ncbi:hypothetical protein ACHWQZ_G009948 [Mnemiopsis leidyi]
MELEEELAKQRVVIGGLLNVASADAKRVLAAYSPEKGYSYNLTKLLKCNSRQLEACASLVGLKARSADGSDKLYQKLEILADRIILKIESLFEAECSDCRAVYCNTLESEPLFTCRLCLLGSHNCEEIKRKAENVGQLYPSGFVWLCNVCLGKNDLVSMLSPTNTLKKQPLKKNSKPTASVEKLNTIKEKDSEEEKAEEEEEIKEEEDKVDERQSPNRVRDDRESEKSGRESQKEKNREICELYKRRACPHGLKGKTLHDGKVCDKSHPKKCFKFCDFGSRHKNGCKRGKKCQYWHPRLCRFSLKNQICEVESCTFQHLVFDKKERRVGNKEPTGEERGERESDVTGRPATTRNLDRAPKFSIASSGYNGSYTPYPPTIGKPAPSKKQTEEEDISFLFKLIENLRVGFQEQLEGLRTEIVKGRDTGNQLANQQSQQEFRDPNMQEFSCPPPFMAITETWLKGYISDAQVTIEGYQSYRSDREDRVGGGCLLYIHDSLVVTDTEHYEDKHHNMIMCYVRSCNTVIATIYRPPGPEALGWKALLDRLQIKIDGLSEGGTTPDLYIVGDFNYPEMYLDLGYSEHSSRPGQGNELQEFVDRNFLTQVVQKPTREGNTLDLVFTNVSRYVMEVEVSDTILSDHRLVEVRLGFNMVGNAIAKETSLDPYSFRAVDYHKANFEVMNLQLSEVNWEELWELCDNNLGEFLELMRLTVLQVTLLHSPPKEDKAAAISRRRRANRHINVMKRKRRKLNARIRALESANPGSGRLRDLKSEVALLCYAIQEGTLNKLDKREKR